MATNALVNIWHTSDRAKQVIFGFVQEAIDRGGAFVQMGTNLWDFAAAAVVAREAGAVVDAREYQPGKWKVIARAAGIYQEINSKAGA